MLARLMRERSGDRAESQGQAHETWDGEPAAAADKDDSIGAYAVLVNRHTAGWGRHLLALGVAAVARVRGLGRRRAALAGGCPWLPGPCAPPAGVLPLAHAVR